MKYNYFVMMVRINLYYRLKIKCEDILYIGYFMDKKLNIRDWNAVYFFHQKGGLELTARFNLNYLNLHRKINNLIIFQYKNVRKIVYFSIYLKCKSV